MTKSSFVSTIFALSALLYLAGCGEDNPPATNTAPVFEEDAYTFTLAENAASGDEIGSVSATDADENATLTYSITTTQTDFAINDGTGSVTVAESAAVDFETTTSYMIQVQVSDGTDTDTADITITLTDVNEFLPEFSNDSYELEIAADAKSGDEVGKIAATDADGTAQLTYTISDEGAANFAITDGTNVASGEEVSVVVAANADLSSLTIPVKLTVTVSDGDNTNTAEVEIIITPVGTGTNAAPVFASTPYTFTVAENAADGAVVGTVSATDIDEGDLLTYSLSGTGAGSFAIDHTAVASGTDVSITVATNADLPSLTSPVALTVEVSDGTDQVTANVEITIAAGNVAPVFDQTAYTFTIASGAAGGAIVGPVSATDSNAGAMLKYSLSGTDASHFAISNTPVASGTAVPVTVASSANLPSLTSPVVLTVEVSDGTDQVTANVEITIIEGNVAPVFDQTDYTFAVNEDAASGDVVDAVSATDSNAGDLLVYTISGEGAGNFAIDHTAVASGTDVQITVSGTASLDHETVNSYTLEVQASDDATSALTATAAVTINVGDVNEHAPAFAQASYIFSVNENAPAGTAVDMVEATDADGTAVLSYRMTTPQTNFDINENTGEVKVGTSAVLDFETTTSYTLEVEASDGMNMATADVTVNLVDVNDNDPVFAQEASYLFSVNENSPASTLVGMVAATDADAGTTLAYSIVGTQTDFDINANGEMTVASATLDFETTPSYTLEVEASDGTKTAMAEVTVNVDDVNEAPTFTGAPYTFSVNENAPASTVVDVVVATDVDANTTLEYNITTTQTDFDINANGEITVGPNTMLDFETTPSYTLEVQASDGATPALTATAAVTINVNDLNDEAPTFGETDYTFELVGSAASNGDEVGTVAAMDADAGTTLEYSIANTQTEFDIDANTGIITVSDAAVFDRSTTPSYTLTVEASDGANMGTAMLTITIVGVDYDVDGDGLIDINNLEQLNAMRWDLDGNGEVATADAAAYEAAFPDAATFATTPTGYELVRNLDFDAAGSYADATTNMGTWTTGTGWDPIGNFAAGANNAPFVAVFAGNAYTISNLYINRGSESYVGLFGHVGDPGTVRDVGLLDVNITGNGFVGGLVGAIVNSGTGTITIENSYATGTVTGGTNVGGLVGNSQNPSTGTLTIRSCYAECTVMGTGQNVGGLVGNNIINGIGTFLITACYATGNVTGTDTEIGASVGGLVGQNENSTGTILITACYATGNVTGTGGTNTVGGLVGTTFNLGGTASVTACYARGAVTGTGTANLGGLAGISQHTSTASYFDFTISGLEQGDEGKTTDELRMPTGYAGIYADWNVDVDGATGADDPWDFGTADDYPVLKVDFNNDGSTADDVTRQRQ